MIFRELKPMLQQRLFAVLNCLEPIGLPSEGTDVWDRVLSMDSKLVVTELRPIVTEYLGTPFPLEFVRKGGYESPEEVIAHLMPQLHQWCTLDNSEQTDQSTNGATVSIAVQ